MKTIEQNSYADDISVMGDNEAEVLSETKNLIQVMGRASFAVKKITSDSKRLIESFERNPGIPL